MAKLRGALLSAGLLISALPSCSMDEETPADPAAQKPQPPNKVGPQTPAQTDAGCGGTEAPKCEPNKKCAVAADCTTGVCKDTGEGAKCQAASPADGVRNADETDVDCGGAVAPKCAEDKACKTGDDCASTLCTNAVCKPITCVDGLKDGEETDVDCGGSKCSPCADGKACLEARDCTSLVCGDAAVGQACQPPSPTDGVKNGTETDVDCGGVETNPRCDTGQGCLDHGDCTSDGCGYDKKCALRRSCTGHAGGDTCGSGGDGGIGAQKWESCCATAPAGAGGVAMNKYQVTAGRMRAFLERVKGNARKVVQDARAAGKLRGAYMPASYDAFLPTSMEGCDSDGTCAGELTDTAYQDTNPVLGLYTSAYRHVGGTIFRGQGPTSQGCSVDAPGTHTYWMSAEVQANFFGDSPHEHPQDVYDTKSLNCVPYLLAQAFCIWDGGRLESVAEFVAAGGSVDYNGVANMPPPWGSPLPKPQGDETYFGNRFPTATDETLGLPATSSVEWANYGYSYEHPNLKDHDFVVFIAAPGRHRYRSANGHADLVGNVMEVSNDVNGDTGDPRTTLARWTPNGSWEGHQWGYYGWNFSLLNKYGKQGLRCVYPK